MKTSTYTLVILLLSTACGTERQDPTDLQSVPTNTPAAQSLTTIAPTPTPSPEVTQTPAPQASPTVDPNVPTFKAVVGIVMYPPSADDCATSMTIPEFALDANTPWANEGDSQTIRVELPVPASWGPPSWCTNVQRAWQVEVVQDGREILEMTYSGTCQQGIQVTHTCQYLGHWL